MITRLKYLFPGNKFYLLILNIVLLFVVSLLDLLGVAAILPVVQIGMGADYSSGYLGYIHRFLGEPTKEKFVVLISIILVAAFIFKGVLSLAIKWWSGGFISRQQTASSVTVLNSYLHEPYTKHRQRSVAEILQITGNANNQVYVGYVGSILTIIGETLSILLLMGLLIVVIPVETLIALVYFGFSAYFIQRLLKKRNKNAGHIVWSKELEASAATLNAVDGFRENIIQGMTDRSIFRYQGARLDVVEATRRKAFYFELPKYLLEIIFITGIALILGVMVSTGGIEQAAYMVVFAGACIRILPNFVRVVATLGTYRSSLPSVEIYERAVEELGLTTIGFIEERPLAPGFVQVKNEIEKLNVKVTELNYKYPDGERNVLQGIDFSVPAGTSVAIVGSSGSGKTTLIDLLLGLLTPSKGKIEVNGQDIHSDLKKWYQRVGYVPQDVFLSGKTIKEEIAYGLLPEEIDLERVWECVRLAELGDLIDSLEQGLDTKIGENGAKLSGGQRQRIGIARAFYLNPSVLILDEATSALDNETEYKITKAINRLSEGRTVFIVAHRLSTVRDVNQLLFMSDGRIVSSGTFSEVRSNNPEFARLVKLGQLPS